MIVDWLLHNGVGQNITAGALIAVPSAAFGWLVRGRVSRLFDGWISRHHDPLHEKLDQIVRHLEHKSEG